MPSRLPSAHARPRRRHTGQIVLNNQAYWILANSYEDWAPRLHKATPRADGQEGYVDLGLGKRLFKFTILALNDLTNYDGTPYALTSTQIRQGLDASYALVNQAMPYVDPASAQWTVRFDHLLWRLPDSKNPDQPQRPLLARRSRARPGLRQGSLAEPPGACCAIAVQREWPARGSSP